MSQDTQLTIDQGTDVLIQLTLVNEDQSAKNLVNHTAFAWMKQSYNHDSTQATKFASTISNDSGGIVDLQLTNIQTDALDHRRNYVFDVELHHLDSDSDNVVERVLQGTIKINPSVTK